MKIKTQNLSYEEVINLPKPKRLTPKKPNIFFRSLVRLASAADLKDANFTFEKDLSAAGDGPYLILMNHSSFIDLEIVSKIMYPKPYCIVCTSDGFVGKPELMRQIGCIPTQKFVPDMGLIKDLSYTLKDLKTSVLMYPEASYSFDGKATPLPPRFGVIVKRLNVPVVMIRTYGAFTRDPLYNCLQKRKINVSAKATCLLSTEQISNMKAAEIDEVINEAFSFDNFRWQQENNVHIPETFRADGLNRILFKCADCGEEGKMEAGGVRIHCKHCGSEHELDEYGKLKTLKGKGKFNHIPDWYDWQRETVKKSIEDGSYLLDTDVTIGMMVDYKNIYMIGDGHLVHNKDGFTLTGADGKLNYKQSPLHSYSLYADYYWYELGDIICIGGGDALYYCFPKQPDVVAKTRLAAEELYKIVKNKKKEEKNY